MAKEKLKTTIGQVIEALPNTNFKLLLEGTGDELLAHLSGKMRMYRIKVLVGDRVTVELNPYDSKRGRIIQRL